jgi:hypothetical protein
MTLPRIKPVFSFAYLIMLPTVPPQQWLNWYTHCDIVIVQQYPQVPKYVLPELGGWKLASYLAALGSIPGEFV